MSRNIIVAAASAAAAAAVAGGAAAAAVIALHEGPSRPAGTVAQTTPAATPSAARPAAPRPTVTVTKPKVVHRTVVVPQPRANAGGADEQFLEAIANDGIKAPDGWALEAGRATCGTDYGYAYNYLTDGGIYAYHVQTFLDDWTTTHGGC